MLGLTPAVWITEVTGPIAPAVLNSSTTAGRSVMSQLISRTSRPSNSAPTASRRSCRTSQSTTGCSRPTILAVASPIPPAPPVITETIGIPSPALSPTDQQPAANR